MDNYHLYNDIKARTGGEIYLGIVGPVRTGKSTFIKRFMEQLVLPGMENSPAKDRTRDELPQTSAGKMIMTTEPKFIPKEAAEISLAEGVEVKVRLIDCVGYMVEGAAGHIENEKERLVKTPWKEEAIPFTEAAEQGTRRVIHDHSTIGLVVTTDGSFGELSRSSYLPAEEKTIRELKSIGKPFLVLLNSTRPNAEETRQLALQLKEAYEVQVIPVNCAKLKNEDIISILQAVLNEFPVTEIHYYIPRWMELLPEDHSLKASVVQAVKEMMNRVVHMRDVEAALLPANGEPIKSARISSMKMDNGLVQVDIDIDDRYYYQMLSEYAGIPIDGEYQLLNTLKRLVSMQKEYEMAADALGQVRMKGYGVVTPSRSEILLEEPQMVRHGNKYGVKIRAQAPSVHLIKARIETEIAPIVGNEQQARDLIRYITENAGQGEDGVWNTNIFGKSIEQIVEDGIQAKVSQLTEDCQAKLQDAMQKIINDSNGGMICIII